MSWGLALSIASTFLKGKGEADRIEDMNKQNLAKFEKNKASTAAALSTLQERTDIAEFEAVRSNLRNITQINKAAHKAVGEASVAAAHKGTGAGKRAALAVFRPTERMAGDLITDANINLETEFMNITNYYNDTALQMIANLNNSAPSLRQVPGTMSLLANSAMTGMQYYDNMSVDGKAQFKGMFKKAEAAGVQSLVAPIEYDPTPMQV